ncbi:MAG: aminoacyl-tRNA hydrolase [Bacteroidales bacterium]
MKFLIVGLGNIGAEYEMTRHNIGFRVVDEIANSSSAIFKDNRYGATCEVRVKNKTLILLKPSTFMNLSGNALRYWMQHENIPVERVLVIVDDLAIPFGSLRLKPRGSDAGHNGLKHIQQILGNDSYPRIRFGIGSDFARGQQIEYVLGNFTQDQEKVLQEDLIKRAAEMVKSFCLSGLNITMNQFNNKK